MPKVRYLNIRFENNIFPYEIPYFRSAVIEKTNRQASLFHNHQAGTGFLYRYPLIQYKVTYKKASIICLDQGTDEIHHLLQHRDLELRIKNDTKAFSIEKIDLNYHQVQIWNTSFHYSLLNWLALSQKHHQRYQELEGDNKAQIDFLHSILRGNILSFAKGIDWRVEEEIIVEITKIKSIKTLKYKQQQLLAFCINFKCNVSLPNFIGLGKGSSVGFGVVMEMNLKNEKN